MMKKQIDQPDRMDLAGLMLLIGAILASATGIIAFFVLFIPDFNIYWMILAPVILVCYQFPAAILFSIYKRRRRRLRGEPDDSEADSPSDSSHGPETGPDDPANLAP